MVSTLLGYNTYVDSLILLGEANITVGAHHTGIIQMVSSNASLSYAEIAAARPSPDQVLFFQLYKQKDDAAALDRVRTAEKLGYKAIFLTVDAIVAGSRERDVKAPWLEEELERAGTEEGKKEHTDGETPKSYNDLSQIEDDLDNTNGTAGMLIANTDMDMTWERTIPWLRSVTKLPIVIKGIQCVEDAILAAEADVDGILISNHGGKISFSIPAFRV
jgi:L-lactate dehydrogenase (cytochrome)